MNPSILLHENLPKRESCAARSNYFSHFSNWTLSVWNITNVLLKAGRVEAGVAAFPDEIPSRLIKLFTFAGENVFDPFLGSGTTLKVARELGRKGIGYEIDLELKDVIWKKLGLDYHRWSGEDYSLEEKNRARNLRKTLQTKVHQTKKRCRLTVKLRTLLLRALN